MNKWHTMSVDSVFSALKTSKKGLSTSKAQSRLREYGLNKLKEKKRKTALLIFIEQFKSFLVILLLAAVIISIFLGVFSDESHFIDAAVIGAIIILNAILGFYQEYKAEKTWHLWEL